MPISPEVSRKRYLDYLLKQHSKGILQPDKVQILIKEGLIKTGIAGTKAESTVAIQKEGKWSDQMNPFIDSGNYHMFKALITKADWLPENLLKHTPEFVHWIDSITYGYFPNRASYKKFTLYKVQAWRWLQEDDNITSYHTDDSKRSYKQREYDRCDENSLYFVNKYGELKEGDIASGYFKYQAREHHAIVCYLFDCGYNVIGGKGRQIGWTSIMGLLSVKKLIFQPNYYIKFVTEDKDTGEEIFSDKIKYPFGGIPRWMQPKVKSDSGTRFWLSDKAQKGAKGYPNSRIDVVAPKKTAINGGSPQLALIDEIGNIGILGAMLNEARPTMFWNNPKTGAYELKRQVMMWGCVCAGTKVWTNDGRLINIEDLQESDGVVGYNGTGFDKGIINGINPPVSKPCYRIETSGGHYIECSFDHPLMWTSRLFRYYARGLFNVKKVTFKKAEEVKVGDQLAMLDEIPIFGSLSVKEARLLGLLIGDGNYSSNSDTQLYVADKEIREYVKNNYPTTIHKSFILKNGGLFEALGITNFRRVIKEHGLFGQTGDNKRLPINIDKFDKKSICELLAGYYDADGNVNYTAKTDKLKVVLSSTNYTILEQVMYLLKKIGIGSYITKENRSINEVKLSAGQKNYIYRLYISRHKDIELFHKNITLLCEHKQKALDKIKTVKQGSNTRNNDRADFIINEAYPDKGEYFNGMTDMSHLRYDTVTKIEYIGEKPIYNLNVSETHTYIANGFITANTGGSMDKGKGEYEKEWYRILGLWEARQYSNGFIPLFFSWHCRFDKTKYEEEKAWYYGARAMKEDIDLETSKTQFHQHYPSTFKDMFLTTASTLVSREIIEGGIDRCRALSPKQQPVYGYFEPVFDELYPMPQESDLPYKLIGARFIVVDDTEDFKKASACIFTKPEEGWENRYWQGTDPIATETGHSKFSSSIWDEYAHTIPAVVNFRKQHDHKYTFLQSVLLGLYYNTAPGINLGVKELVEANIGTNYTDYKELKGFFESLVFNSQLPSKVTGGTRLIGIDNKGNRANAIIDYMTELFRTYHDRIYIPVFFEQLSTFVQTITGIGRETWGPMNRSMHFDDCLYSATYAYINRQAHMHLYPTRKIVVPNRFAVKHKLVRLKDYSVVRQAVKIPVYETYADGEMHGLENVENLNNPQ